RGEHLPSARGTHPEQQRPVRACADLAHAALGGQGVRTLLTFPCSKYPYWTARGRTIYPALRTLRFRKHDSQGGSSMQSNRRRVIGGAAGMAALGAFPAIVSAQPKVQLKLSHYLPPTHGLHTD